MKNRGRRLILTLVSIIIIVVLVICYFLFFSKNEVEDDNYPRVDIYKYEISSNKYKYFLDKLDASKIGLKDVISYRCKNNECSYVKSLFAEGNINGDYVLIQDGKDFLLYNYIKKKKNIIAGISNYSYADFIGNGSYILISNNNDYYIYDIDSGKVSNTFKSELLVSRDKDLLITNNNVITVDNNKYGMVNIKTGNNTYDNVYDFIDCNSNICLFSVDGSTTVYDVSNNDTALIQSAKQVLYYDENVVVYNLNDIYYVYDIKTKENKTIALDNNDSIKNVSYNDGSIIINLYSSGKCYKYPVSSNVKEIIACKNNDFTTDIFVSSINKANLTVTYGTSKKSTYDLKVLNNKLYNSNGNYYDYLSINSEYDNSFKKDVQILVKKEDAYKFLNDISTRLRMDIFERMTFINRWMPVLYKNGSSIVDMTISEENNGILDINILTRTDDYRNITMIVTKGDKATTDTLDTVNIKEIDRSESSVLTISGINY